MSQESHEPEDRTVEPDELELHDDEGLELALRIARTARGSRPLLKKRKQKKVVQASYTSARADDHDPQLVGDALSRLADALGWTANLNVHQVLARWPLIVGPQVAQHSHPENYTETVLTVRTASTAWATQLRMLAPTLVARLNEELGQGTVTRIVVKGPDAPSWKHGMRSVRDGRGQRDTYG